MSSIIGIGDNVVDKYIHLSLMFPGGNAVNVPVFMARLGARAAYLGYFGEDAAGAHLQAVLSKEGIDLSHSLVKPGENAYAIVNLIKGEREFVADAGSNGVSQGIQLSSADIAYISTFDLIHTSIYSGIEENLQLLKDTGVPISFDFSEIDEKCDKEDIFPYINFAFFSGGNYSKKELKDYLIEVSRKGPTYSLATRGSEGALLYYRGNFYEQSVVATKVVDTMGAGDSFIGGFLLALLEGRAVEDAMESGAILAAKTCTYQGTFGYGVPIA